MCIANSVSLQFRTLPVAREQTQEAKGAHTGAGTVGHHEKASKHQR